MKKRPITAQGVIDEAARLMGVTPRDVRGKRRQREIVLSRHLAMHFLCLHTAESLKSIGLIFGGRDHSTVLHARNRIASDVASNPAIAQLSDSLRERFVITPLPEVCPHCLGTGHVIHNG
jgi:chromosomal replication initiator protein